MSRAHAFEPLIAAAPAVDLGGRWRRLQQDLLTPVLQHNRFYRRKLSMVGLGSPSEIRSIEDFRRLPFTSRAELSRDQVDNPPYGSNLTYGLSAYTRVHQTSGTTGQPLRWLDTSDSWDWWARCWGEVYRAAGVDAEDRIFFAFSFGPFIGFWSAFEGARRIGALAIPGGGMSSYQRLQTIVANRATVLICTPTYALHLAEVAEAEGIDIAGSSVRVAIHAGEPGASIPATRQRIEDAWGCTCFDHVGSTEVGAWGFETAARTGVVVNEHEFICEVIDPVTCAPAIEGELVMTNLGRPGMPVIRYRTGDRVRIARDPCPSGTPFVRFEGGVIGRTDDAISVRGVNVFPSTIENVVRQFPEIAEFAIDVFRRRELDDLEITIELKGGEPEAVTAALTREIQRQLALRALVKPAAPGALPRFELKARRVRDHRGS